jgi:regulator of sirC expression with transglutaminase-like and TPR domain
VNRLSAGDVQGALADLDRVIELAPDDAYGLLKRSEAHAQLGGTAAARRDLGVLLENQPTGPAAEQALHALGNFALAEGDVRGAYGHFDRLVGIAPYSARALAERGATLAALGRDVEALEDLELAVDRDPSLAMAHAQMAVVLLTMGRKQEACYALHSAHALGDRSVEEMLMVHCER